MGSVHSGSSSGPNVRRFDRSVRIATRAWCTASGSPPVRTIGSWRSRCATDCARTLRITSLAAAPGSTGRGDTSGGSIARGPRARTCFGVGSGAPAPAPRRRLTSGSSAVWPSGTSTSISRKRAATRRPSRTETSSSTTSARRTPAGSVSRTRRRTVDSRATGLSSDRRT